MLFSKALSASLLCLFVFTAAQGQSRRLRPSENWKFWADTDVRLSVYRVPLSKGRNIVAVGDMLYLLNQRKRILWSWESGAPIWDAPVVDSDGTIYVVGPDLLWAAVDSVTGQEKWRGTANGRAAFTQIKLYRSSMYLVVTDMSGYRESLRDNSIEDTLSLCKNNALLWETSIPAHTRLQVRGRAVFVVYKRKGHFIKNRVLLPRRFKGPISRIDGRVDYDGRPIVE